MIYCVMAVKDVKLDTMFVPFFTRTVWEGRRMFAAMMKDSNSMLSHFPSEFSLYLLGTYDDGNGRIEQQAEFTLVAFGQGSEVVDA